jgi:hypothetical protein
MMRRSILDSRKDRTEIPGIFTAVILAVVDRFVDLATQELSGLPAESRQSDLVGMDDHALAIDGNNRAVYPSEHHLILIGDLLESFLQAFNFLREG